MLSPNSTNSSAADGDAPVAFLDSGVGGLPYLEAARERMPAENFTYLADRGNFPYGTKTREEVFAAVRAGVEKLLRADAPKAVVLACNTASVVALGKLRGLFPTIPFIGVVPAVKPAAERSKVKRIGVLATNRTLQDAYLDELVRKFASSCEVVRVAGPGIVEFVENSLFSSDAEGRRAVIREATEQLKRKAVDAVVLGCTHFLYVREEIRTALGAGVEIIDSRAGVVKQIAKVLEARNLKTSKTGPGRGSLYLTGTEPPEKQYYGFAEMFGLEIAGIL